MKRLTSITENARCGSECVELFHLVKAINNESRSPFDSDQRNCELQQPNSRIELTWSRDESFIFPVEHGVTCRNVFLRIVDELASRIA